MEFKIDKINVSLYKEFLKKLLELDKHTYMKITDTKTISNSYVPVSKNCIKSIQVNTPDLFSFTGVVPDNEIKMIFYNTNKVTGALSKFAKSSNLSATIKYRKIRNENVATDIIFKDKRSKITVFCADHNLKYMDMDKTQLMKAFSNANELFSFDISDEDLNDLKSYFKYEKDYPKVKILTKDNNVYAKGETYELLLAEGVKINNTEINNVNIDKEFFNNLDNENYSVSVCDNKLIFDSRDTESKVTFATIGEVTTTIDPEADKDLTKFFNDNFAI